MKEKIKFRLYIIVNMMLIFNIVEFFNIKSIVIYFLLSFFFLYIILVTYKEKLNFISLAFGFFLSTTTIIGRTMYIDGNIIIILKDFFSFTFNLLSFSYIFGKCTDYFLSKIKKYTINDNNKNSFLGKIPTFCIFLIVLMSFILCFLAFYPGIFSYDMNLQTTQAFAGINNYSKYIPPIHTMFWSLCIKIGDIFNYEAIAIYEILQMIITAFVISIYIKYIVKKAKKTWIILFTIVFLIFNPVVSIISLISTKDVFFSLFFILFNILLFSIIEDQKTLDKKCNKLLFCFYTTMLCLLRNNAIYVVLILAFICYFIKFNKITTPLFIGIVLYFFINNAVYSFLGINEGLEKEKISVPINQLSLAYINNDFSLEDEKTLNNFLDVSLIEKKYNRRFADDLKFIFRDDVYRKKKLEFYKLYIKCFVKYPYDYINAFIDLNLPYWYLQSSTIDEHSKREYLEVYVYDHDKYSFQRKNNSKILYSFYSDIANFTFFEKNIILKILNSISLPIYFIVFTLVTIIYKKKYRYIIITLPSLLLWLTYLLGPVSNFRYVIPIYLLYPFYIFIIFNKLKLEKK